MGRHRSPFETGIKSASISHSQVACFGMKTWRHAPGHLLGRVRDPTVTIAGCAMPLIHVTIVPSMMHGTATSLRALNTSFYELCWPIMIDVVVL